MYLKKQGGHKDNIKRFHSDLPRAISRINNQFTRVEEKKLIIETFGHLWVKLRTVDTSQDGTINNFCRWRHLFENLSTSYSSKWARCVGFWASVLVGEGARQSPPRRCHVRSVRAQMARLHDSHATDRAPPLRPNNSRRVGLGLDDPWLLLANFLLMLCLEIELFPTGKHKRNGLGIFKACQSCTEKLSKCNFKIFICKTILNMILKNVTQK